MRVTIRGIPLTVEDSCITKTLEKLGAELTSDIKYEKIRNPSTHKMTEILNGNRFVYMKKKMASRKFLPKHSECAGLKCTISHKGQPTNCWADDHARFQCEYETCCKVCKKPNHTPGDPNCANYDSAKKNMERMTANRTSTRAILKCLVSPIPLQIYYLFMNGNEER